MLVLGRAVLFSKPEKKEMKATCAPPFRTGNYRKGNPSSLCRASPPPKDSASFSTKKLDVGQDGLISMDQNTRRFFHHGGSDGDFDIRGSAMKGGNESDVPMFLPSNWSE